MTARAPLRTGTDTCPTLIVAGLSVRGLAESARRAGWHVLALDAFGDQDTRRASTGWWGITDESIDSAAPRIDAARLLAALRAASLSRPTGSLLLGWVAGAGFEAQPDLLRLTGRQIPLLGMSADSIAALREPRRFFGSLAELGIEHPEVDFEPPAGAGWLLKDMASSGGQAVRRWPGTLVDANSRPGVYWQGVAAGRSLACLLLARGQGFDLLGVHEQLIDPTRDEPYRFAGVVGPAPLSDTQRKQLLTALQTLVTAFDLRGLVSVDWLLDGDQWLLLEINPRPSASLAVHERLLAQTSARSLLAEHVAQFLPDEVRAQLGLDAADRVDGRAADRPAALDRCSGERIVYAPQASTIDAATLARWAVATDLHDIPSAPMVVPAGAPVLSVSAIGPDTASVMRTLDLRRADVLRELPGAPAAYPGPGCTPLASVAAPPSLSTHSSRGAHAADATASS